MLVQVGEKTFNEQAGEQIGVGIKFLT